MAAKTEGKKEKAALVVIPVVGVGALVAWLLRRKVANPDLAVLYGLVTDAETNAGIANINVACGGYTAKTNAAGEYQIINIEPGSYLVTFTDPRGYYEGVTI